MRNPSLSSARRMLGAVVLVLCAMGAVGSSPQEMPVPMDLQVSLLKRIWAFDRAHQNRFTDDLVVAVVYQELFRPSLLAKNEFTRAVHDRDWGPHAVRVVELEIPLERDIGAALRENNVDIIYVTPLRAAGLDAVIEASRRYDILTCTGVPAYVADGVSVGLDLVEGRPRILVNITAAKAEGADFSSQLLRLAEVGEDRP